MFGRRALDRSEDRRHGQCGFRGDDALRWPWGIPSVAVQCAHIWSGSTGRDRVARPELWNRFCEFHGRHWWTISSADGSRDVRRGDDATLSRIDHARTAWVGLAAGQQGVATDEGRRSRCALPLAFAAERRYVGQTGCCRTVTARTTSWTTLTCADPVPPTRLRCTHSPSPSASASPIHCPM